MNRAGIEMSFRQVLKIFNAPSGMYETWEDMLEALKDDIVVAELKRQYLRNGHFENPIQVDPNAKELANGCHRMTALHQLGNPHNVVSVTADSMNVPGIIVVEFFVSGEHSVVLRNDYDAFGLFRSFWHNDLWFEADGGTGGFGHPYKFHYYARQEQIQDLIDGLIAHADRLNLTIDIIEAALILEFKLPTEQILEAATA